MASPAGQGSGGWAGAGSTTPLPSGERRPVAIAIGTRDVRPPAGLRHRGHGRGTFGGDGDRRRRRTGDEAGVVRLLRDAVRRRLATGCGRAGHGRLQRPGVGEEQAEFVRHQNGWTGVPHARQALPFADENSWSPAETLMRLVWEVDAELPRPMCNVSRSSISTAGISAPRTCWTRKSGLMGEYDGSGHLLRGQRARDVRAGRAAPVPRSGVGDRCLPTTSRIRTPTSPACTKRAGPPFAASAPGAPGRSTAAVVDPDGHCRATPGPHRGPAAALPRAPLGLSRPAG